MKSAPKGEYNMAVSKAQQKATAKYVRANYDRIEIKVPKGRKEEIQAHCEARGESVNGFINRVVSDALEREKAGTERQEAGK